MKKDPQIQRFTARQLEIMIRWILFSRIQWNLKLESFIIVVRWWWWKMRARNSIALHTVVDFNDNQNDFLNCMKAKTNKHKLARATWTIIEPESATKLLKLKQSCLRYNRSIPWETWIDVNVILERRISSLDSIDASKRKWPPLGLGPVKLSSSQQTKISFHCIFFKPSGHC